MSDTTPISWTCEKCGFPIPDGAGCVGIPFASLAAGTDLTWHVTHDACQDTTSLYGIDVEFLRTHREVLTWTAHLLTKSWFSLSSWGGILRLALDEEATA